MDLREEYRIRREKYLNPIADELHTHLEDSLQGEKRIDRIVTRPKDVDRFVTKAESVTEEGSRKYDEPLSQIQDQIGGRIITFYPSDIEHLSEVVKGYYNRIEEQQIVPESEREFGYVGKHFILFLPPDILPEDFDQTGIPPFFELQIKTLFQHAWSEAEHDLGYKPERKLSKDEKRKMAFTAAQAWGADMIFLKGCSPLKSKTVTSPPYQTPPQ